ncbi:unnamed protein product [Microthlaspi erraticum]|uniref:RING-type domain-containing protein n=1 Tax=Microthlaspi erraticum TaxID=1685480 RepID=A0A6D2HVU1_9BRAS|nr:unnamed protein product [Microthlaspi erraticum]CAA7053559.1 unnamed protein product [Microthlaspi erraticum]
METKAYMSGLVKHPRLSLVGKFFTSLVPPSFDRTESTLRQQWKLSGGLKVFPLEKDNIILFEFEHKSDKKNVIMDGPWNVDGIIIVLKQCPQNISMSDIDFSATSFWVKVIGLPYFQYTQADAVKIVNKLSDKPLISLEYDLSTRCFLVRAKINLRKPLSPGFYINGRGRKRPFVQFKYKNLGIFCEQCGMVGHRKCGEVTRVRPLTREFQTHVYGPWLRYDNDQAGNKSLPVKLYYVKPSSDWFGLEYEETVTFAQFYVRVVVDVIYASEHEWGGKKLTRSLLKSQYDFSFRFPCFPTSVIKDVIAFEIDGISSLEKLTEEDKEILVNNLVDHIMKQRKSWSGNKWVPFIVGVEKTVMIPPVDMEAMLEEDKDIELFETMKSKIYKLVGSPVGKSDDLVMKTIGDAIAEVGLIQFEDEYFEWWMRGVRDSVPERRLDDRNHKGVKVLGPDMDLFGTCCICQEDFILGEDATFTSPCSHLFHTYCINEWIQETPKCPLCCIQLQIV